MDKVTEKDRGKGVHFERIRRITGYLTGSLDSWNTGKRAEEKDRVKHGFTFIEVMIVLFIISVVSVQLLSKIDDIKEKIEDLPIISIIEEGEIDDSDIIQYLQ